MTDAKESILAGVAFRVAVTVAALLFCCRVTITPPLGQDGAVHGASYDGGLVERMFVKFDSYWYVGIAEHGYRRDARGVSNVPFFPAYPSLMAAVSRFGLSAKVSGVLISHVFAALAIWLAYAYTRRRSDGATAGDVVLWLCLFPTAWALQMVYSESLFCASLFAFLLFYDRRNYGGATACALVLPLTRAVGLAIVPAMLCDILWRWRCEYRFPKGAVAPLAGALAGFAGLLLFYQCACGDPFAFVQATRAWPTHVAAVGGWAPLPESLVADVLQGRAAAIGTAPWVLAYFVGAMWLAFKERSVGAFYCLFYFVMLMQLSYVSQIRYLLPLLPVHILLARRLLQTRYRLTVALGLAAIQVLLTILVINWSYCI